MRPGRTGPDGGRRRRVPAPLEAGRAFAFPRQRITDMRQRAMAGGFASMADYVQVTLYIPGKHRAAAMAFRQTHGHQLDPRTLWQSWFGKKAG